MENLNPFFLFTNTSGMPAGQAPSLAELLRGRLPPPLPPAGGEAGAGRRRRWSDVSLRDRREQEGQIAATAQAALTLPSRRCSWELLESALRHGDWQCIHHYVQRPNKKEFHRLIQQHAAQLVDTLLALEPQRRLDCSKELRRTELKLILAKLRDERDFTRYAAFSVDCLASQGCSLQTWLWCHGDLSVDLLGKILAYEGIQALVGKSPHFEDPDSWIDFVYGRYAERLMLHQPDAIVQQIQVWGADCVLAVLGTGLADLLRLIHADANKAPFTRSVLAALISRARDLQLEIRSSWWLNPNSVERLELCMETELPAYLRLIPSALRPSAVRSILERSMNRLSPNELMILRESVGEAGWATVWQPGDQGSLLRLCNKSRQNWLMLYQSCPVQLRALQWGPATVDELGDLPSLLDANLLILSPSMWAEAPEQARAAFLGLDKQGRGPLTRHSQRKDIHWINTLRQLFEPESFERLLEPDGNGDTLLHSLIAQHSHRKLDALYYLLRQERISRMWIPNKQGQTPCELLLESGALFEVICAYVPVEHPKEWLLVFRYCLDKGLDSSELVLFLHAVAKRKPRLIPLLLSSCPDWARTTLVKHLLGPALMHRQEELVALVSTSCPPENWLAVWTGQGCEALVEELIRAEWPLINLALQYCPEEIRDQIWGPLLDQPSLLDYIAHTSSGCLGRWLNRAPQKWRAAFLSMDRAGSGPLHRHGVRFSHSDYKALQSKLSVQEYEALWLPDKQGRSPLMCALSAGPAGLLFDVDNMLDYCPESMEDCQWNWDEEGLSCIAYAARSQLEFDETVIVTRCPPDRQDKQWCPDKQGRSVLLHYLIQNAARGRIDVGLVNLYSPYRLLQRQLNTKDPETGRNPLHYAAGCHILSSFVEEWREWGALSMLSERDALGMRPLDIHCARAADFLLIPHLAPQAAASAGSVMAFVEAGKHARGTKFELVQQLYRRCCERFPAWARGQEERPELVELVDSVRKEPREELLAELLGYTYRMNQSLPCTEDGLKDILDLLEQETSERCEILLALQTGATLSEAKLCVRAKHFDVINFDRLTEQAQIACLCRAQVLRTRSSINLVKQVLKRSGPSEALLQQALKYLCRTEIQVSSKTLALLHEMIRDKRLSRALRSLAIQAAAAINADPYDPHHKHVLVQASAAGLDAAIAALARCSYSMQDAVDHEILAAALSRIASSEAQDTRLRSELALLLMALPNEHALRASARIVNGPDWDALDAGTAGMESIGIIGDYLLYPFQPRCERNRRRVQQMLAERYVELQRERLDAAIAERMQAYATDPDAYPQMQRLQNSIESISEETRYVPFPLFFPAGTALFRGLNARKGQRLLDAALDDVRLIGGGSVDLSLHQSADAGTWAKVGLFFMSSSLDGISRHYFDQGGLVLAISSEAVNEAQLRCQLRYELEATLNAVSYERLHHHKISQLFVRQEHQDHFDAERELYLQRKVLGSPERAAWKALSRCKRVAIKRFLKPSSQDGASLADKTRYFDPSGNFLEQISQSSHECSDQAFLNENLERQAARELLCATLAATDRTDPLYPCLLAASQHQTYSLE